MNYNNIKLLKAIASCERRLQALESNKYTSDNELSRLISKFPVEEPKMVSKTHVGSFDTELMICSSIINETNNETVTLISSNIGHSDYKLYMYAKSTGLVNILRPDNFGTNIRVVAHNSYKNEIYILLEDVYEDSGLTQITLTLWKSLNTDYIPIYESLYNHRWELVARVNNYEINAGDNSLWQDVANNFNMQMTFTDDTVIIPLASLFTTGVNANNYIAICKLGDDALNIHRVIINGEISNAIKIKNYIIYTVKENLGSDRNIYASPIESISDETQRVVINFDLSAYGENVRFLGQIINDRVNNNAFWAIFMINDNSTGEAQSKFGLYELTNDITTPTLLLISDELDGYPIAMQINDDGVYASGYRMDESASEGISGVIHNIKHNGKVTKLYDSPSAYAHSISVFEHSFTAVNIAMNRDSSALKNVYLIESLPISNQTDNDYYVHADWAETDTSKGSFIRNKPVISSNANNGSTTITHLTKPDEDINKFSLGCPVFLSGNVYRIEKGRFVPVNKEKLHYTECICGVMVKGEHYVGIVTNIDKFRGTITFASHGDFIVTVNDSSLLHIGDVLDYNFNIINHSAELTVTSLRSIIGVVTNIIDSTHVAIFKD